MSDFLSKFEDDQYDGESIITNSSQPDSIKPIKKKPKSSQRKQSEKEDLPSDRSNNDEIIVYDKSYKDKQKKKKLLYAGGAAIVVLLLIIGVLLYNLIKVPNLVDKNVSDAKAWAQKGNVNLIISKEYSIKQEENMVVSQEKKKGSRIWKNSDFEIVISQGANPDEKIEIPNLLYMDVSEITDWKEKNKLDNVNLEAVFSRSVSEDKVVDIKYDGDFVNAGNYHRRDSMTIKISKGKPDYTKNIVVPDLKTTDIYGVKDWAEENKVTVYYAYQAHPKIAKDNVIKQSITKGKKMSRMDALTVTISLGKGAKVPDFSKMTKEDAAAYSSSLNLTVKTMYNNKAYGKFVSQSVAAGSRLYSNKKVVVIYSEGKPFIDDVRGYTRKELDVYFYKLNLKGAKLKHRFHSYKSGNDSIGKGEVVEITNRNKYVGIGSTIYYQLKK